MNKVSLTVNGRQIVAAAESMVASVLLENGIEEFRTSVGGSPRSALCGMGICFECRVQINGSDDRRSCQTKVEEGMTVVTSR